MLRIHFVRNNSKYRRGSQRNKITREEVNERRQRYTENKKAKYEEQK